MELSLRLASCEMKSMPSLLMAPQVLIAMMTRRMLGAMWRFIHRQSFYFDTEDTGPAYTQHTNTGG